MKLAKEIKAIADMARSDSQSKCADHLDRMSKMVEDGQVDDARKLADSMVQWTLRLVSWHGAFDHAVMARDALRGAS